MASSSPCNMSSNIGMIEAIADRGMDRKLYMGGGGKLKRIIINNLELNSNSGRGGGKVGINRRSDEIEEQTRAKVEDKSYER